MNITDALRGEHAVLYALFTHMELSVPTAESLSQVKTQAAMLAAALASHAHLEEALLFTTLELHIGSMGLLAMMRKEHERIERALEQLPAVGELGQAQKLLLDTVAAAREHFAKEEQALFQIASRSLSADTLTNLGVQWAARRGVVLT